MLKTSILLCSAAVAIAAQCSSLSSTEKACTAGTFRPDNECSGTTCVAADDVGDATKHCCRAADVTGKCDGNTIQASNIDCSNGDGTTGGTANTRNKGASVTGSSKTACCTAAAATVTGMCTGNTVATADIDCSHADNPTPANTENKGDATGDSYALCCQAVTAAAVTGMCTGNTDVATNIDCSNAANGTPAHTENKGSDVTGDSYTLCCQAVTATSTGALCTTGGALTTPLTCGTGYKAKAALTSKCVGDPCLATDYTGLGAANLCCEVKASPTDSGASSLLPNFLFAAAGLIAWY